MKRKFVILSGTLLLVAGVLWLPVGGGERNSRLNGSEVAKGLDRLSSLSLSLGDLDRAEAFSQSAASIRMSHDRNHYPDLGLQANYINLVDICCMKGEYERAERFLAKAGTLSFNRLLPEVTQSSGVKSDPSEAIYFNAKRMIVLRRFADADKELKRLLAAESYLYGDNFEVRSDLRLYIDLFTAMNEPLEAKKVKALVDSKARLSAQDLAPYVAAKPNTDDFFYHPILKTLAGHGLERDDLPDSVYRSLNGCVYPISQYRSKLSTYFRKAELDALARFCVVAKGKSQRDIEELAGKPALRLGQIGLWSSSKPGEENWIYRLGYLQQAANLTFVDDRCMASRVLTGDEDCDFQHWRAEQIVSFSRGKTVPEILRVFGTSGLRAYSKGTALPPAPEPVIETLCYSTGPSISVSLPIKHCVCTEGSVDMIAH